MKAEVKLVVLSDHEIGCVIAARDAKAAERRLIDAECLLNGVSDEAVEEHELCVLEDAGRRVIIPSPAWLTPQERVTVMDEIKKLVTAIRPAKGTA